MVNQKRLIKLGWGILEHKFRYYVLDDAILPDNEYDLLEREYEALAKELGVEPTAINMVGFKDGTPSAALIRRKVTMTNLGGDKCLCGQCEWS